MQIKISFKFMKADGTMNTISQKTYLKILKDDFNYVAENDVLTFGAEFLRPNEEMSFIIREATPKEQAYY